MTVRCSEIAVGTHVALPPDARRFPAAVCRAVFKEIEARQHHLDQLLGPGSGLRLALWGLSRLVRRQRLHKSDHLFNQPANCPSLSRSSGSTITQLSSVEAVD
jgi:hypothetical protein